MDTWKLPVDFYPAVLALSQLLHGRLAWRLEPLLIGVLFSKGRRTVTSWLRAAGIGLDFRHYYYFLGSLGRKVEFLAVSILQLLVRRIGPGERWLFALDDTPTKRYGPCVEGAGYHHNPTPGPTDQKYLFGHVWVTLAWVVKHPLWGTLALPLWSKLYVRACDVAKIVPWYKWSFATKLQLAAEMLVWLNQWLRRAGKQVWIVVDGFYNKKPFLQEARRQGMVVVGRLRRDARLRSVPVAPKKKGRGRPRLYGKQSLSLAKRAAHPEGWLTVLVRQYGKEKLKTVKTFLATWEPAGGVIRVVIVREEHTWLAFACTDPEATVEAILEAAADRSAIEQTFHDVKEVHGAGQQQLRNLWANIGAWHLVLWTYTLIEWWSWGRSYRQLCDRSASPWDDEDRRPSHADKRKALQNTCLREEFSASLTLRQLPRKIQSLVRRLIKLIG